MEEEKKNASKTKCINHVYYFAESKRGSFIARHICQSVCHGTQ